MKKVFINLSNVDFEDKICIFQQIQQEPEGYSWIYEEIKEFIPNCALAAYTTFCHIKGEAK